MRLASVGPKIEARVRRARSVDVALSVLLVIQALTLFAIIPLGTLYPDSHALLDGGHLVFALVCVTVLTRRLLVRVLLVALVVLVAGGALFGADVFRHAGMSPNVYRGTVAVTAFVFTAAVTVIVARHVFGASEVTAQRVLGAVLLYLNAASLFAIAFGVLVAVVPGAVAQGGGRHTGAVSTASLTYFSIATLTTATNGDLVPVHPIARCLANMESVFGQLFPATVLARIVALHLRHDAPSDGGDRPRRRLRRLRDRAVRVDVRRPATSAPEPTE